MKRTCGKNKRVGVEREHGLQHKHGWRRNAVDVLTPRCQQHRELVVLAPHTITSSFSYQQASYLLDLALRSAPLGHQHGRGMHLIRRVTFGSLGTDLLIELGPDDLDELAGLSGPYPEPESQGVGGYRLLVSRTMSGVLSPRLSQECLRRAPNDCLLAILLRGVLVRLGLGLRRTVIRVRLDSRLQLLDVVCDGRTTGGADRLQ